MDDDRDGTDGSEGTENGVRQLRLVVTAGAYDEALTFYRDVLGLAEEASFSSPDGRVTILSAGRATLEITDPANAEFIDEVEVGGGSRATYGSPSRSPTRPRSPIGWPARAPRWWRLRR